MLPTSKSAGINLTVQYNESRKPYAHFLIYGKTKAGKTTTANSLESDPSRNAIISTQPAEQLAHVDKKTPYVVTPDIATFEYAVDNAEKLFPNAGTLIVDDLTEICSVYRGTINVTTKSGETDAYAPYNALEKWIAKIMWKLTYLPMNLVITAFERSDVDATGADQIKWVCADFPKATAAVINSKMDFITRINDFKLRVKKDESRRIMAGNRWPVTKMNMLKDEVEPNLAKIWALYQEALV